MGAECEDDDMKKREEREARKQKREKSGIGLNHVFSSS